MKHMQWAVELGLGPRIVNCLHYEGIHTLDQLCGVTKYELLAVPNFGGRSLRRVEATLATFGRSLFKPSAAERFNAELIKTL